MISIQFAVESLREAAICIGATCHQQIARPPALEINFSQDRYIMPG